MGERHADAKVCQFGQDSLKMIVGIGVDIIETGRVKKACEKNDFMEKYFTDLEREFLSKKNPESAAGNFCCKEAAAKALGTGFKNFLPDDIEVLRNESGAPEVRFYGKAKETADRIGAGRIHASITHGGDYAAAFVVLEDSG